MISPFYIHAQQARFLKDVNSETIRALEGDLEGDWRMFPSNVHLGAYIPCDQRAYATIKALTENLVCILIVTHMEMREKGITTRSGGMTVQ